MRPPLVSVCIPTRNGIAWVREALASLSDQTYRNLEVIISDDASTDGTWDELQTFAVSSPWPVQLIRHSPSGIGANWNHCLQLASGNYIKFLFQDDVLLPECIGRMVEAAEKDRSIALVACKRDFILEEGARFDESWIAVYGNLQAELGEVAGEPLLLDKSLFRHTRFYERPYNKIGEPTAVLFRRSVAEEIGTFNEVLRQILDYEYWYRILQYHKAIILPDTLVKFRLHVEQASQQNVTASIDDYDWYERHLYTHYRKWLHPTLRKELTEKYGPIAVLSAKIKYRLNRGRS